MTRTLYIASSKATGRIGFFIGPKGLEKVDLTSADQPAICRSNGKVNKWLRAYLQGRQTRFPYPINIHGTKFQMSVWGEIAKIPSGKTKTYGEIAKAAGYPKAVRAVGAACGANPVPLVIPCHRVVAANGIGGFSAPLAIKKQLLAVEKRCQNNRP